ncbi:MAG TPA: FAD-binding oxidoreductase, partial [Bdellovibrionales bacterium]|nr:FAD-binding oxidoreductase [Bdellovibrionales bacterium]
PRGLGRSYGDSCLTEGGELILTRGLDRFLHFEADTGLLRCEAGVTIETILEVFLPRGWFPPVVPGTKFVTVGGAIANDIHGKNHHKEGSFGHHVTRFQLLRSDGNRPICSASENPELFRATIGGLGLTGLIQWAEFRLMRVPGPWIRAETIRYRNLDEFFDLSQESAATWPYIVAWVDCLARGDQLGRGLFTRGDNAYVEGWNLKKKKEFTVPSLIPFNLVNSPTIRAFNFAYIRKQWAQRKTEIMKYDPFYFPLDTIHHWNRIYGPRGFVQYQCVVPYERDRAPIREIFDRISKSGVGSFLTVLKVFGNKPPAGLLSFPMPGVTLAFDAAVSNASTFRLLDELDRVVLQAGGRVYPAKDARMTPETFAGFYPNYEELARLKDPALSSAFWRRVTGGSS